MDMLNCCQPTDINSQQLLSILRELHVIIEVMLKLIGIFSVV